MHLLSSLAALFAVSADQPELNRAQLRASARQIPIMYGIVIVGTIALGYTHIDSGPWELTLGFPLILIAVSVLRMSLMLRTRHETMSDQQVVRRLRSTVMLACILGLAFIIWSLSLYPYGDAYARGHVAVYSGVTTFGCVACLMHLRAAALALTLAVVVPFSTFFLMTGEPVFTAIAVNMMLVAAAMMFVMFGYARDFANLIDHQRALIEKQVETQRLSDANSRLANLDSLTNLPNRRSFFSELERRLAAQKAKPTGLAVGVLDLDGFKPINDVYGHPTGDKLLVNVGQRLLDQLGHHIFVARLGGDEFGLIIEGEFDGDALVAQGELICQILRQPFDMTGFVAQMSGSVGLAKYPDVGDSPEVLFERADYALYHAKEFSPGGAILFSDAHEAQIREVSGIERRLRDADMTEEMSVMYQPIVDVSDGRAVGFEVLARWNSPVLGVVPPNAFIRAAERAGLINQLTEVLFLKALDGARDLPADTFLSFNLSSHDIGSSECVMRLIDMVRENGLSPQRLTFEVTETAVMQDYERGKQALLLLKSMGASIALDDFGTGYSSLSYVRELPLDRLKVDGSFVTEIENDKVSRAVMRTVVDLCRNLELECIVEGVETEGQLAIVEAMGCSKVQGYVYSKPMSAPDAADYVRVQGKVHKARMKSA